MLKPEIESMKVIQKPIFMLLEEKMAQDKKKAYFYNTAYKIATLS